MREALPQDDPHVFDRVVLIDVEISVGFEVEVEAAVLREKLEHVVEETNAGRDFVASPAVNAQARLDPSFLGIATNLGLSHWFPIAGSPR